MRSDLESIARELTPCVHIIPCEDIKRHVPCKPCGLRPAILAALRKVRAETLEEAITIGRLTHRTNHHSGPEETQGRWECECAGCKIERKAQEARDAR